MDRRWTSNAESGTWRSATMLAMAARVIPFDFWFFSSVCADKLGTQHRAQREAQAAAVIATALTTDPLHGAMQAERRLRTLKRDLPNGTESPAVIFSIFTINFPKSDRPSSSFPVSKTRSAFLAVTHNIRAWACPSVLCKATAANP